MKIDRRNDLSLRLLEVFGTLMIHRTTVAAAEELGISQPSVSNAVKQLEAQLGFALFARERQRLMPTDAAVDLFREVEPLFEQLRIVESRVRDLRNGTVGKLRIISTPPLGHTVVPQALSSFMEERPGVSIQYDVRRVDNVIEQVASGATDIGLCLGLVNNPGIATETMRTDRMVAVMKPDHPLAQLSVVGPADLSAFNLIGLERDSQLGLAVQNAFNLARVSYAPQAEVRYCHTAAILANACDGVAVVDNYTSTFMPNMKLVARPFDPPIPIPACLLIRQGHEPSRLVTEFRAAMLSALNG